MITIKKRPYKYYKYGDENGYGQITLSKEPAGEVNIAIFTATQNVQDNILYQGATYLGLTNNPLLDDKCVIQYNDNVKLKILYINPEGRYRQVFMTKI